MVITTPSAICSSLSNISPEEIFLTGLRYATRWFEGRLYLCLLRHDADHDRDLRRVLRWDPGTARWTDVYTHSLSSDHHGRKTLSADPDPGGATHSFHRDRRRSPASMALRAFNLFSSRHTAGIAWNLPKRRQEILKSRQRRICDLLRRFLHWQVHEGMIFALIEQTDGSKSLIRATIERDDSQWERVAVSRCERVCFRSWSPSMGNC